MSEGIVVALMLATVLKLVDFVRQLRAAFAGEKVAVNAAITQAVTWVGSILVAMLVANSAFADQVGVGGITLASAGLATQIIIGIAVGSGASTVKDALKAVDNTQSARVASLIPTDDTTTGV